jgi:hypothetical protein
VLQQLREYDKTRQQREEELLAAIKADAPSAAKVDQATLDNYINRLRELSPRSVLASPSAPLTSPRSLV